MIFYSTSRVTLGGSVGEEVVNQRGHGSRMTKCTATWPEAAVWIKDQADRLQAIAQALH